jgi:hypothetical protein
VTSHRRRKQKARALGLDEAELRLCELFGEVLELVRWNQVLLYSNQYLLQERLGLGQQQREEVMHAAARAVEQDGRLQDWSRRLLSIEQTLADMQARLKPGGKSAEAGGG